MTTSSTDLVNDAGYSTDVRGTDGEVDGKVEKCSCSSEATEQGGEGRLGKP